MKANIQISVMNWQQKTTYLVLAKLVECLSNLELSCLDLVSYCQNGAKLVRNTLLNGPWIPN